jgi:hypothetical protein
MPFAYFGDFVKEEFALVMPISPRQLFVCVNRQVKNTDRRDSSASMAAA